MGCPLVHHIIQVYTCKYSFDVVNSCQLFVCLVLCSPYRLTLYVIWYVKWVWRYSIQREEYSDEDKIYITRKKLKLTENRWKVCIGQLVNIYTGPRA